VLWLSAAASTTVATALLVLQLRTIGTTAYYFVKFFTGVELVLAAAVPAVVAMFVATVTRPHRLRAVNVATVLGAVIVCSQVFGMFRPGSALLLDESNDGTASVQPPYSRGAMAAGILSAASDTADVSGSDYIAIGRAGAVQAFYPDGWYHALDASLSSSVYKRLDVLRRPVPTAAAAAVVGRRLLAAPRERGVVSPEQLTAVRFALEDPELARRVSTWPRT